MFIPIASVAASSAAVSLQAAATPHAQVVQLTGAEETALGKLLAGEIPGVAATPAIRKAVDYINSLDLTKGQKVALGHLLAHDGAPGTAVAMTPKMQDALNGLGAMPAPSGVSAQAATTPHAQVVQLTEPQKTALGKLLAGEIPGVAATPTMMKAIDYIKSLGLTKNQTVALGHLLAHDGAPGTGVAMTPKMQDALNGLGAMPQA